MTTLHRGLSTLLGVRPDQSERFLADSLERDYEAADSTARAQLVQWLTARGLKISGTPSPRALAQLVLDALVREAAQVAPPTQHEASALVDGMVRALAESKGMSYTAAFGEVQLTEPSLVAAASGGPWRLSMSAANRPADSNQAWPNPAPAARSNPKAKAADLVAQHMVQSGGISRRAAILSLLNNDAINADIRVELEALLADEADPRAEMRELVETRMSEKKIEYRDALREISTENPELVERAAAVRPS